MPYNHLVPKGLRANLEFRRASLEHGRSSARAAHELWMMCSRDPLFWCNTFVWTYNPRLLHRVVPFILYDFQERTLLDLVTSTGVVEGYPAQDLLIEKSRDMGASWLCIMAHAWPWQFREFVSFLWVSRKEDLVDKTDDPDSMMWKMDLLIRMQPVFMRPHVLRNKLHFKNEETRSTIDGASTTGDVSVGGRRTGMILDEFASVDEGDKIKRGSADVTQSRLFNSTPRGTGNAFYALRQSKIARIRLHWTEHPVKSMGLYTAENGRVKILDEAYKFPEGYAFILDGKMRSPWYDAEEVRRASAIDVAQELDIDYLASGSQFFDQETLQKMRERDVRQPYMDPGDALAALRRVMTNKLAVETRPRQKVTLGLWCFVQANGEPTHMHDYVIGVDTSSGSDASPSAASVLDLTTNEKVAELTTVNVLPHDFAKYVAAMGRWFGGKKEDRERFQGEVQQECLVVPEANGPGQILLTTLRDVGYGALYLRKQKEGSLDDKRTTQPGWYSSKEAKLSLFGDYRRALGDGTFINRSLTAIEEHEKYVYLSDGSVGYAGEGEIEDPSGARHNHGDRTTADALANKGARERSAGEIETEKEVPAGSLLARRQARRDRARKQELW